MSCFPLRWLALLALLCSMAVAEAAPEGLMTVRGDARELIITPDGTVLALDRDGRPWRRRRQSDGSWASLPGQFAALRAGLDGSVWGITAARDLYRLRSDSWWAPVAGAIDDVAAGPDGAVLLRESGRGWREEPASGRSWPAAAASYVRGQFDAHGLPWLWRPDGHIARYDGTAWQQADVPDGHGLRSLVIGADGDSMLIDDGGAPWRWDAARRSWQALGTDGAAGIVQVALGPRGKPWFVGADGRLLASDLFDDVSVPARPPALFTRLLSWQRVRGQAQDISIGADGTVLTVDREGSLWQWKGKNNWSMLPGQVVRVAVAADGSAWAVLRSGRVARQVRGFWQEAGFDAVAIAAAARGDVWALRTDGQLALLARDASQWQLLHDNGGAVALAAGKNGEPWIIDSAGEVRSRPADVWLAHPGIRAVSLAVGPEGTVYATTADLAIYWLDPREQQWKPASGKAARIAVGPKGAPWVIGANDEVLASAFFLQEEAQRAVRQASLQPPPAPVLSFVPAPPASVLATLNKALVYTRVDGRFIDISAGADGSVFAVGAEGGLYCYNPDDQRFLLASSGAARRVAAAAGATPWLVNASQDVSYFDRGWQAVADFKATDISVAQNGGVFAVAANSQQVYRYSAPDQAFVLARDANGEAFPKALKVAALSNTMLWLIAPDQQVWRCSGNSCIAQGVSARDIGIGPEGSVLIVDLMGAVRRFDFKALMFKPAGGSARELSVGPQGLPWLVDADGAALASALPKPSVRNRGNACNQRFSGQSIPMARPPALLKASADSAVLAAGGSLDILANDSLNGMRPVATQVSVVFSSGTPYLAYAGGLVTVLAGAPPGTLLNASYKICQLPPGSNCSSSVAVTVAVPGTVSAQPDHLTLAAGQATAANALLANDAANGRPAVGQVTLKGGFTTPGLAISADGAVTVGLAVAAGNYAGSYQICLADVPTVCAVAAVSVAVQAPQLLLAAPNLSVQLETGRNTAAGQLLAGARLNGGAIGAGMVTVSGQFAAAGIRVNADASVSVAAGTAPGVYAGNFQLCLINLPVQCASGNLLLTVTAPAVAVAAQADSLTLAPGQTSAAAALLANDSLNGVAPDPRLVTVSGSIGAAGAVVNANGSISVAATTAAGTYGGNYQVCAVVAPTICAGAALTLTVAPTVSASMAGVTLNSGSGQPAAALLARILVNGRAAQAGQVTIVASFAAGGVSVTAGGAINVASGTPAGLYAGSYSACLSASPSVCATAALNLTVLDTVQAQPDSFVLYQGNGSASILANDTISGQPLTSDQLARVSFVISLSAPGIGFNTDGSINVASDAAVGSYTGSYRLCVAAAPANCTTAAIRILVRQEPAAPPVETPPGPVETPPGPVETPPSPA
jgi:hypothetical protein